MMHAVDQILAAVAAQLAGIAGSAGVYRKPLFLLDESDLDGIVIDEIEDEITETQGVFPATRSHALSFSIKPVVMAPSAACLPLLGELHQGAESALFGSRSAITLGGLINSPLQLQSDIFFSDAESLQSPVCGWRMRVVCTFFTRSDKPGIFDRG